MANLEAMLRQKDYDKIWTKYCSFLDLSINEFMQIQKRLLMEQIELLYGCELGQKIMGKGNKPKTIEEFRQSVPLTTYEDYTDILLNKNEQALPSKPLYWIKTTWKGGTNEIKLAPYSENMIMEHAKAFIASLILATSKKKGEFTLRQNDKFLYGMAPLPYLTGLAPYGLKNEIDFEYLPSIEEAENLSFEERNKIGFQLGLKKGVDLFFGLSSILVKIGEDFVNNANSQKKSSIKPENFNMLLRLLKVFIKKHIKKEVILPKDIWNFKGILCAGTDTDSFKQKIEYYWGKRPIEIYGGTEIATVATETWGNSGLTFFPDVNFLEFITEKDSLKSQHDKNFIPKTMLLNEIKPNNRYEIVTTKFKGGSFIRYRVGDIIECLSLKNEDYNINLPQIKYVDRISNVIDLAGFTRITKATIDKAIDMEDIPINEWTACKEYEDKKPILHLYIEMKDNGTNVDIIKQSLNKSLKELDPDYRDFNSMLGVDPLKITILPTGVFKEYKKQNNRSIIKMNPNKDSIQLLKECSML